MKGKNLAKKLKESYIFSGGNYNFICLHSISNKEIKIVTTNSYVLAMLQLNVANNFTGKISINVSKDVVDKISKLDEILSINFYKKFILINEKVKIETIEKFFPNYETILWTKKEQATSFTLELNKEEIVKAIKILKTTISKDSPIMNLTLDCEDLIFETSDDYSYSTFYELTLNKTYNGINKISISLENLEKITKYLECETFTLSFINDTSIILIKANDDDFVIMPMENMQDKIKNLKFNKIISINSSELHSKIKDLIYFIGKDDVLNGANYKNFLFQCEINKISIQSCSSEFYKMAVTEIETNSIYTNFLVDGGRFLEILQSITGDLSLFTSDKGWLKIKYGQGFTIIPIASLNIYYDIPQVINMQKSNYGEIKFNQKEFDNKETILVYIENNKVLFCNKEKGIELKNNGKKVFHIKDSVAFIKALKKCNFNEILLNTGYIYLKNDNLFSAFQISEI